MYQHFQNCVIFGKGRIFEQVSCLKELSKISQAPWPVILTTPEASLGQDLASIAYVIQVAVPESFAEFVQNSGRSNRIDPNAPLIGALITTAAVYDIESVKQGCEFEQQRQKFFRADYLQCIQYLECCCLIDSSLPTFKSAFKLFQKGTSAAEIYKVLIKAPKFKIALEVAGLTQRCDNAVEVLSISKVMNATTTETVSIVVPKSLPNSSVQQPEEVKQKEGFSMIGKRKDPEKLESFKAPRQQKGIKGIASYFKQKGSSGIEVVKQQQAVPQNNAQKEVEVSAFAEDQMEINMQQDEVMSDDQLLDCLSQEQKEENTSLQSTNVQLNPEALKHKAVEEAMAVLEENGYDVPEIVKNNQNSRSDSVILFGEKDSGGKKREAKRPSKEDDKMSMISGKTSGSKYKNGCSSVICDLCQKSMRKDKLKEHRGGRKCKAARLN